MAGAASSAGHRVQLWRGVGMSGAPWGVGVVAGALGLRPSWLFPLIGQIQRPGGWWVRACDGETVRGPFAGEKYRSNGQ